MQGFLGFHAPSLVDAPAQSAGSAGYNLDALGFSLELEAEEYLLSAQSLPAQDSSDAVVMQPKLCGSY